MWTFQISGYPENKSCKMDTVREIKLSTAVAKAAFNNKIPFNQQIGLKFKEVTSKTISL